MKILYSLILLQLLISRSSSAQTDEYKAHFRSFSGGLNIGPSLNGIRFMPNIDFKLLNGLLEVQAKYEFEVANKDYSKSNRIVEPNNSLVSTNFGKPFHAYEAQVGFNFFGRFRENTMLFFYIPGGKRIDNFSGTSARNPRVIIKPGSKAYQLGVHVGFGGAFDNFPNLSDNKLIQLSQNGNLIPNNGAQGFNNYAVFTTVNSNFIYGGLHYNLCKKPEDTYDKISRGEISSIYVDYLYYTLNSYSNVVSPLNEVIGVKDGPDGLANLRIGYKIKGTGKYGITLRYEYSLQSYGANENYNLYLGVHITPLLQLVNLKSRDRY